MKKILLIATTFLLFMACEQNKGQEVSNDIQIPGRDEVAKPEEFNEKYSFTIGYDLGRRFVMDSLDVDLKYFFAGVKYGMIEDTTLLSREEFQETMNKFQAMMDMKKANMQEQMAKQNQKKAEENLEKSKQFLTENIKKEGVRETKTGLQYKILEQGTGNTPSEGDFVKVNVIGRLTDGTEFENTYESSTIVVDTKRLIPGWKEAMLMMKEGSRWNIWVPPSLGYGEQGMPPQIPPNEVINFEVEFLSIEDPEEVRKQMQERGSGDQQRMNTAPPTINLEELQKSKENNKENNK